MNQEKFILRVNFLHAEEKVELHVLEYKKLIWLER